MNLLYLPTIIALIAKYGPYLSELSTVAKAITPVAQELITAITPVIQKELKAANIDTTSAASIVTGVKQVLNSLGHPPMTADEEQTLTDRLSAMT